MTYPNVLVMGYLKAAGQLTPEWRMKLESAINQGYQRLLTFEVRGGGFDWYGNAPANTMLTAYGLMELHDMNAVYPIDMAVVERSRKLLAERQIPDGSWSLDRGAYSWRQIQGDLPVTAYVTWAIVETGATESRGLAYLESHYAEAKDPYTLALVANAFIRAKHPLAARALADLEKLGVVESPDVEALALAALAFLRGGSPHAEKAVAALVRAKDPQGGWPSTQSTILAIKALLEGRPAARPQKAVPVALRVNGQPVELGPLTPDTYDIVQQVNVTPHAKEGENEVEIACDARISVQVAGRCWIPWALVPEKEGVSPLSIEQRYDKARLARGEKLRCDVTVRYTGEGTFMVIADLGIPPGFAVETSAFEQLVAAKRLDKFAVGGRQITLYFGAVKKGDEIRFAYDLRPKFPISAKSPRSHVYEYYAPDRQGSAKPVTLEVTE